MSGQESAAAANSPRHFGLPKAGNSDQEYEDAARISFPDHRGAPDIKAGRAVICDGASESAFAREWANTLADAFVANPLPLRKLTPDSFHEWLELAQAEWRVGVPWDQIPWHGEPKARRGSYATLLGLSVGSEANSKGRFVWRAVAVGDSCLFLVRGDRLCLSFPLRDAAEFDDVPDLICSNPEGSEDLWASVRRSDGECEPGDRFFIASDALACWFLARSAEGGKPWDSLWALDEANWAEWVDEQRRDGLLLNDDTTLIILEVG